MSDLGYGTETAEPAVASGSDAGNSWHGEASPADAYGRDPGAFAAEEQLPARQDSRAATWDDDLGYDEAGLPGNADDDLDGLTDGLAPRQDAYDATWGDNPQWDEAGLSGEYEGDLGALMDGLAPRQDAYDATWGDNPQWDDPDDDADMLGANHRNPYDDQEAPAEGDDDTAELGPQPSAGERDRSTTAEAEPAESAGEASARAEGAEQSPGGGADSIEVNEEHAADQSPLSASDRIAELEARLERLEHRGDAESSTGITGRERDTGQQAAVEAENPQTRHRRLPNDAALAMGAATAGGILTTVADFVPFMNADVAGIVSAAVAVGATTITWIRARREAKDAHRPEGRAANPRDAGPRHSR